MSIQNFTKYFYPNLAEGVQEVKRKNKTAESDDEDDEYESERENMPETLSHLQNPSLAGGGSSTNFLGTDNISSSMSINQKSRLFK